MNTYFEFYVEFHNEIVGNCCLGYKFIIMTLWNININVWGALTLRRIKKNIWTFQLLVQRYHL